VIAGFAAALRDGTAKGKNAEAAAKAIEEARKAGATIGREPAETFWGGYSGVFIDPDGDHYRTRMTHTLETTAISRVHSDTRSVAPGDLFVAVGRGIDYLDGMLANAGLPAFLKYGVYIGEVLAPLAVIAGYYARVGAWVIAVNMLFAIALVGAQDMFTLSPKTGGLALELEYFYLFSAIALALIGPGRYAVNQK